MFIETFFSLGRVYKRLISLSYDALALLLAYALSSYLRLGEQALDLLIDDALVVLCSIVFSLLIFVKLGLYRAIIRYMGAQAILVLIAGTAISTFVLISAAFFTQSQIPRSVPLIFFFLALALLGGPRWMVRYYVQHFRLDRTPVCIYGAGYVGRQLLNSLQSGDEYKVIALIDDDPKLNNSVIRGVTVCKTSLITDLIAKHGVKKVLLATDETSHQKRRDVLKKLEPYPVEVQTIPSMADVVAGKAKIEELREVDIDDLLGRDSVEPDHELLTKCITDKVVMVTGAGGSIGSELCRQISKQRPKALVLFELSEYALYSIEHELNAFKKDHKLDFPIHAFMGSVQHKKRLSEIMSSFEVDTVYHAAAYKHVPLVEHNIIEGIRNNVFGTCFTAEAAIEANVETFVLISTDKAVRPTNFMGASKRLAELVLQAKAREVGQGVRFCMVRFGNVLGSSGSVVPLFRKQIRAGGPVTLTHPEITRYFMTIPEASQLVIQAGSMGKGGDVFVLDMGESVKILDLATRMIHLMGLTIHSAQSAGDIEIIHTGLRPGEKLYEELLVGDNVQGTEHPKIMTALEEFLEWNTMKALLDHLDDACHRMDCRRINELILNAPVGFNPQHDIQDMLWGKRTEAKSAEIVTFTKN